MQVSGPTVKLTPWRGLELEKPLVPGLPAHLASGSGLARHGDTLYVVPDDGLDAGVFQLNDSTAPGKLKRLFDRPELPVDLQGRKRIKPDLESCAVVEDQGHPALLTLGSGSGEARNKGVYLPLDEPGPPVEFDLQPLYQGLRAQFPTLNIEGAAPLTSLGRLRLAQRGDGPEGVNAVIDLDLNKALEAARSGGSWGADLVLATHRVELGTIPGQSGPVPLTLTDLGELPGGRCIFTAAAEDTPNPVDDGPIAGSALGILEADGRVSRLSAVDLPVKLEGVTARVEGDRVEALVVTDNDEPLVPSELYRATL